MFLILFYPQSLYRAIPKNKGVCNKCISGESPHFPLDTYLHQIHFDWCTVNFRHFFVGEKSFSDNWMYPIQITNNFQEKKFKFSSIKKQLQNVIHVYVSSTLLNWICIIFKLALLNSTCLCIRRLNQVEYSDETMFPWEKKILN